MNHQNHITPQIFAPGGKRDNIVEMRVYSDYNAALEDIAGLEHYVLSATYLSVAVGPIGSKKNVDGRVYVVVEKRGEDT